MSAEGSKGLRSSLICLDCGDSVPKNRRSEHWMISYLGNRTYCMDLFYQLTVGLKKQQKLEVEFVQSLTELQLLKEMGERIFMMQV